MDFHNQNPIFMQIADLIMDSVLEQKLRAGDRVSSVRELAASVQVNPNTVMRAFTYLQDKGVIFNQRGIGYYIADDAFDKAQLLKKEEFVSRYLPELFKRMNLLGISLPELERLYKEGKSS
jgi:DNA-binding transcriptional regulator YhcF (GntR family)